MAAPIYEPIDSERYEARVISLEPGDDESPIRGTLTKISLLEVPRYHALSYCWGGQATETGAVINGVQTSITRNLDQALRYARRQDIRTVWADALCINQSDTAEKNKQVGNMGQIYRSGAMTISWLGGSSSDRAELAIKFLHLVLEHPAWTQKVSKVTFTLDTISAPPPKVNHLRFKPWLARDQSKHNDETTRLCDRHHPDCSADPNEPFEKENDDDDIITRVRKVIDSRTGDSMGTKNQCYHCLLTTCFDSLIDLMERPYWRRRWIIQEIAASSRVTIVCGETTISIQDFQQAIQVCCQMPFWQRRHATCSRYLVAMLQFRQQFIHQTLSLSQALIQASKFLSQDPRDAIYSLMGISSDGSELVPMPNYYHPPNSIALRFTRALIRSYGCLDLMWADGRVRSRDLMLPAWSPDWLAGELPGMISEVINGTKHGLPQSYVIGCLEEEEDINIISLEGVILGTVVARTASTTCGPDDGDEYEVGDLPTVSPHSYYGSSSSILYGILSCAWHGIPSSRHVVLLGSPTQLSLNRFLDRSGPSWRYHPIRGLREFLACHIVLGLIQRHLSGPKRTWRSPDTQLKLFGEAHRHWYDRSREFPIGKMRLESWIMQGRVSHKFLVCLVRVHGCILVFFSHIFVVALLDRCVLRKRSLPEPARVTMTVFCVLGFFAIAGWFIYVGSLGLFGKRWWSRNPPRPEANNDPQRLVLADTGMMAQAHVSTRLGDKICFLAGCTQALVLRPVATTRNSCRKRYQLVGKAVCVLNHSDRDRLNLWVDRFWYKGKSAHITDAWKEYFEYKLAKYRQEPGWEKFNVI